MYGHALGQDAAADVPAGVDPTAWGNLIAGYEWLNANPLPDNAPDDAVQTRQLVIAALVAAQTKLQSNGGGTSDPTYQAAATAYNSYKAAAYQQDMPSPFALGLANLFGAGGLLDLSSIGGKLFLYGGLGLGVYLLGPPLVRGFAQGMRGSKSV